MWGGGTKVVELILGEEGKCLFWDYAVRLSGGGGGDKKNHTLLTTGNLLSLRHN